MHDLPPTLTLPLNNPPSTRRWPARDLVAFTAIILVAFFFRTYRLPDVPGGLTWDEAAEGLDATDVLSGRLAVFFPANSGHEPALAYLHAATLKLLGWSSFSMRLPNAFFTTLAVAATFLVARRLFGWRVAWLASFLQGVVFWQIAIGRFAARPAMLILFVSLTVYWLDRWLSREQPQRSAALCGLCTGLALYVYTPARFIPILVGLVWLAAFAHSKVRRRLFGEGILAAGVAAVTAAPLGWYFLERPQDFFERTNQISIFSASVGPLWLNLLHALRVAALMFAVDGEPGWDRDIAHLPLFDPVLAALFAAGVILAVLRWRQRGYGLVLAWMMVMMAPMVLTSPGWPDFGRAIGITPAVFMFPAIAAATAWQRWPRLQWLLPAALVLPAVSFWQYFGIWANAPGTQQAYRPGVFAAAQSAASRLLATDAPARVYLGAPDDHDALTNFVLAGFAQQHAAWASKLVGYDAQFTRVQPSKGSESYLAAAGRPEVSSVGPPPKPLEESFDSVVRLEGYSLGPRFAPNRAVTFRLWWQPAQANSPPVTFFAHLLDFPQQHVVAAFDHNGFPASQWRGGETVLSEFPLQIPEATAPGAYWLELGSYSEGQRRLQTSTGEDRLLLGPVVIAPAEAPSEPPLGQVGHIGLLRSSVTASAATVAVDLRWLPLQPIDRDYTVFAHLLDRQGKLVAQSDGPPAGGLWPTRYWQPGTVVEDKHVIPLPPVFAPGQYVVSAGLYHPETGQRLPTTPAAGPEPDSIRVGEVTLGG